ncbi:MAG: hypothetical protein WC455_15645 [Dehalococcoidia bacterium]|jgi:hypothetical protein
MAKKKTEKTKTKYTASEIVEMVEKKRNSTAMADLRDQMDADFDLYSLIPYKAETGHQSYTSPKPRNDFGKVYAGLNKASLTWQVVVPEDAPKDERDAGNRMEAFYTGVLDRVDRQLRQKGEPPLRQGLSWFACARGAIGLKCLIYTDQEKNVVIDIGAEDPLHTTWERGTEGLAWKAYEYSIGKVEALQRYDIDLGDDDEGRVIDFYDTEINAIVLTHGTTKTTKEFVKEPTPHGLDHVPGYIGFAGGMPTVYNSNNELQLKHRAASVYHSSRTIYEPFNKQVSFIMDAAEKSVAGALAYTTEDGKKGITGDPFSSWKIIKLKIGEKLEALQPPKVPAESSAILELLDRDKQESTVPFPIGYGLDPQAHSGAALAMINDNMRSIYDPFAALIEDAYHWLLEEIAKQFVKKGQKLKLNGFDKSGKFFQMDIKPHEVKDDWYIQIKCEPKLPRDEAGELRMALEATQGRPDGEPMLSYLTAREKIVKIQNPDSERTRIQDEKIRRMIEASPQIQIRRVATKLLEEGDREGALELLASLPAPNKGRGAPQGEQQPPPNGQQPSPPQPGGGEQPAGGQGGQLSPQMIEQAKAMAEQLAAQGKPIPKELQAILARIPAPQGGR